MADAQAAFLDAASTATRVLERPELTERLPGGGYWRACLS